MNQELNYYMNLSYRMEIVEDKEEGISMNQYCLYLLAKNDTEYKKERR